MELRQLRYFRAICQHGSITAAAQALHVSQPALTVQLAKLEEEFGCSLVVRSPRGVRVSDAGEVLLSYVKTTFDTLDEARRAVCAAATQSINLRVGIPPVVSRTLTIPLLKAVALRLPGVTLEIQESMSGTIRTLLLNNELDLAITSASDANEYPGAWLVQEEDLYVGVRSGSDIHLGRTTPFTALAGMDLVCAPKSNQLPRLLQQLAEGNGIRLHVIAEVSSTRRIFEYVLNSDAAMVGPRAFFDEFPRGRLSVSRLVGKGLKNSWKTYVVFPRGEKHTQAVHLLAEIARELIKKQA